MSFTPNDDLNDFIVYELANEEDTPKKTSAPSSCLAAVIMLVGIAALLLWL